MNRTDPRQLTHRWILVAALAVFLVYALNFLYFFVDDEGIPLVYAQNLLRGRGLSYSSIEGPVEGYSDFLHVMFSAGLLALVHTLGWPRLSVFFLGKAAALAAGAGSIVLAFQAMQRSRLVDTPGALAGMAMVATAGPLAVWSCSSLETVPFVFLVMLLAYTMAGVSDASARHASDRLALVAGTLTVLERLDGPLFVAAIVGASMLHSTRERRRELLRRIVWPVLGVLVVYHAWRFWYFHDVLNMPLYAKVLYKLRPHGQVVVKAPARAYILRFLDIYGWTAVTLTAGAMGYAAWRERAVRPTLLAVSLIGAYVAVVSDWMFGFRFFTPLLPPLAVLLAEAVTIAFRRRRGLAWAASLLVVVWCGRSAFAFEREYERVERNPSWLLAPSKEMARYFGTYHALLDTARSHIGRGQLVAYNQAGFLPFMLDLENIDNLGICSRFYAKLPDQDVFFTEVGRYAPLTPKRSIQVQDAYLLYRDVPFLIQRGDLLRNANDGRTPLQLVGGYYAFVASTGGGADVIYRRTDQDASEYKTNPRLFFENVAHVAYIRGASINGAPVPAREVGAAFPYLREAAGNIMTMTGGWVADIQFADEDVEVSELDVNEIRATAHAELSLELRSVGGALRHAATVQVAERGAHDYFERFAEPIKAGRLRLKIVGLVNDVVRIGIADLRVQGQTPALARYVRESLIFPAR